LQLLLFSPTTMPPKRITDDGAPKARKPRAPKERPPGMTNAACAADVERRQTETRGRAEREKKLTAKRVAAAANEQARLVSMAMGQPRVGQFPGTWPTQGTIGTRIALLKETSAAKKRNTDLAFLIGGNDAAMDEEARAWYDAHRQEILRPPLTTSASPSTTSTPAADDASLPEAQEGTADEPVVL
jgi:hypothetical protein